jgi:hypothetical protein
MTDEHYFGSLSSKRVDFAELVKESDELLRLSLAPNSWVSLLRDKNPSCRIATYKYGALIQDTGVYVFADDDGRKRPNQEFSTSLGVLLSGSAELCEERCLPGCIPAYWPTRLFRPGDFFGDFGIVDDALIPGYRRSQGRQVSAGAVGGSHNDLERAREAWLMFAGRRSVIIAAGVDNYHIDKFKDDSGDIRPHMVLNRAHSNDKETRIALFQSDELFSPRHPFFNHLIQQAWRRAHTYRTGLNAYNFLELLEFRRVSIARSVELMTKAKQEEEKAKKEREAKKQEGAKKIKEAKKTYNSTISIDHVVPIFVDAVFDALNRPMRNDLVFAHDPSAISKIVEELEAADVDSKNVWVAAEPRGLNEFYYPVDVGNFYISATALLDDKIARREKPKLTNLLSSKVMKIFTTSRGDKEDNNRPQRFYIDLFGKVFEHYKRTYPNYPFEVNCVSVAGLSGRMLVLKFKVAR